MYVYVRINYLYLKSDVKKIVPHFQTEQIKKYNSKIVRDHRPGHRGEKKDLCLIKCCSKML